MKTRPLFWHLFPMFLIAALAVSLIILEALKGEHLNWTSGLLMIVVGLGLASWWLSYRLGRTLNDMRKQAKMTAEGDFSARVPLNAYGCQETYELGQEMNQLAIQVEKRLENIQNQKNEQDAVFLSMSEGVLVVDREEKIKYLNLAAGHILGLSTSRGQGMSLQEAIKIPQLQDFIQRSLKLKEPAEEDITLLDEKEKQLQVRSSPLRTARGQRSGSVIVFNDVSRIRRLENMRRDFVANVSHELRTPLTSIQGFSETLLNPSVQDPEQRKKFLEIIHQHSARLSAIIEDLLSLSRIERETEHEQIELTPHYLRPTLNSAVELCQVKAERAYVQVKLNCPTEISASINPPLLEQACVNLIDNAIKYSTEGTTITVEVLTKGKEVEIAVTDSGPGIPAKHLNRIFERFYRVDKARSRKMGGTGLGLSIVKHIALAHRGNVSVRSEEGVGSTFSILLKSAEKANTAKRQPEVFALT